MSADTSPCRCGGTGAYTVEVPIADAVVITRRMCVDHVAPRTLVTHTSDGLARSGEVMDIISTHRGVRVFLRPPGGGKEWTADPEDIEVPADAAA